MSNIWQELPAAKSTLFPSQNISEMQYTAIFVYRMRKHSVSYPCLSLIVNFSASTKATVVSSSALIHVWNSYQLLLDDDHSLFVL
mmetsp:Transcript_34755/g.102159  ORF Transcript_34755/g.102159 Transcript_34755/m.102159 type:complete len:85 (+) Transcript_34755:444-698(+)